MNDTVHVFLVGSMGLPPRYGGFETFVDELTRGKSSERIRYYVACLQNSVMNVGQPRQIAGLCGGLAAGTSRRESCRIYSRLQDRPSDAVPYGKAEEKGRQDLCQSGRIGMAAE